LLKCAWPCSRLRSNTCDGTREREPRGAYREAKVNGKAKGGLRSRSGGLTIDNTGDLAQENSMGIIAYLVLGLIAGFIASKIVDKQGKGLLMSILIGVVGAELGGFLFRLFGMSGVTGFNVYSLFVAVLGAVVLLFIYHQLIRRRA
jgi:uncharacterized membrane protein YeaQ/YmgE (transglycosylase-associated protein family)